MEKEEIEPMRIRGIEKEEFEKRKKTAFKFYSSRYSTYISDVFVVKNKDRFDLLIHHLEILDEDEEFDEDDEYFMLEEYVTENWIQVETTKCLIDFNNL